MPRPMMTGVERLATDWPSAISANMPPSPLLSARSRIITYLSVTMSSSVQVISDSTPNTASRPAKLAAFAACTASRNAYSGLVPMSP